MLKSILKRRRIVQLIIGIGIYIAIFGIGVSLMYVFIGAVILGTLLGKTFCRWMCPLGFIMELMTSGNNEHFKQNMYNYHKVGCPIAWVQGFLNKFSIFKIKRDKNKCTDCGLCDSKCYISSINSDFSLYKKDKQDPAKAFNCSKCLECVSTCPTNSLNLKIGS